MPMGLNAELDPTLVLQPASLERMQSVVKYLYDSNLDFAVRNTGTGSVSAQDIIAKGFAVVGARCPWVGITGSALVGGLSWLSHEFGKSECRHH